MQTKLTLKLDKDVIADAKDYAARNGRSLSQMVEGFFKSLVEKRKAKKSKPRSIVAELSGILKGPIPENWKEERTEYLMRKYGLK